MSKIRTVVDLLAEQSIDAIKEMREVNRAELARAQAEVAKLKLEAEQLDQALKRAAARGSRITGEDVLDAALEAEPPFAAADVAAILSQRGREASINAVRNHLNRLAGDRGVLTKHGDGRYSIDAARQTHSSNASFAGSTDDDIPF